jgi:hypothetical protein
MAKRVGRRGWGRIHLPPQLFEIAQQIAAKHGFQSDEELHRFVYFMLKQQFPKDVAALESFNELAPDWLMRAEQDAEAE